MFIGCLFGGIGVRLVLVSVIEFLVIFLKLVSMCINVVLLYFDGFSRVKNFFL